MKYLILGSSGQVGHHLKNVLNKRTTQYIPYDIVETLEEDLRNSDTTFLESKIQECDFVFFLAFDIGGSHYMEKYQDTFEFISNNIKIMNNVFNILNKYKKPFIFTSSQMSNMSYSTYGLLKAVGEKYTQALNGLTVKFWNVYGYEKDTEKFHVITDFIKMAKSNGVIQMRTDGKESRQFLHGDDAAECLIAIAENYKEITRDTPLHITSFKWTPVKKIAEIIRKVSDCEVKEGTGVDTLQRDKKNTPNREVLKFWSPKISLEEGIKELYLKYE